MRVEVIAPRLVEQVICRSLGIPMKCEANVPLNLRIRHFPFGQLIPAIISHSQISPKTKRKEVLYLGCAHYALSKHWYPGFLSCCVDCPMTSFPHTDDPLTTKRIQYASADCLIMDTFPNGFWGPKAPCHCVLLYPRSSKIITCMITDVRLKVRESSNFEEPQTRPSTKLYYSKWANPLRSLSLYTSHLGRAFPRTRIFDVEFVNKRCAMSA